MDARLHEEGGDAHEARQARGRLEQGATLVQPVAACRAVGPRHVGLGLDYCFDTEELDDFLRANPQMYPPEDGYASGVRMLAPEQIPEIVEGLLRGGYGDDDVRGILGGNLLRVARRVWKPVGAAA